MSDTLTQPDLEGDESEVVYVDDSPGFGGTLAIIFFAVLATLAVPLLTYLMLNAGFNFLADKDLPPWAIGLAAILVGTVGTFALFTIVDYAIKLLPNNIGERVRPYAWAGPAMVIVGIFLLYPAIDTVRISFMNATSTEYIGFENYVYVFTDPASLRSLRNTLGWVFIVPIVCVGIGLGFAVLADRLQRTESFAKSMIFLPMAISFIGAGIVWRFVYSFRIEGTGEQIGVLNAMWTSLGNAPVDWLRLAGWNNIFLMIVMVWLQTGFAMVILSAAIKGVPGDILEAARIDGATEIQVFWRVVVPSIMSSIVVVYTTMMIQALKVFDIVWVMTGGQAGTEVIAERMIRQMFTFRDFGRGAAVATFMFLAIVPIMILNIRRFREEEAQR